MASVKIDAKLLKEIRVWLDHNGNKYRHPTLSSFVNNAVYEKLQQLKNNEGKV